MNYIIVLAAFLLGLLAGYFIGLKRKVALMDGDLCIAKDEIDNENYLYLRLNNDIPELEKHDFIQLKVVLKKTENRE